VVLSAREKGSPQSAEALEELCRTYWYPLYAFARGQGHAPAEAEDLTQEFFARLLQKNYLDAVARERGRFRTFMLVAFKRFMAEQWRRRLAQKRCGAQPNIPFDTQMGETLFSQEPAPALPAEQLYEQRWALALLEKTMARLRAEFRLAGREAEFDRLKTYLTVADAGGVSGAGQDGALRVAVHRLRKRFRQVFREEISQTLAAPEDLDEEVRHLLAVLSS
jgi:RNA polymerase sigma-70 factor (ECF subfamily)